LRSEKNGELSHRCFGGVDWNKDLSEHLRPPFWLDLTGPRQHLRLSKCIALSTIR
jgi:hypothetical protein